MRKDATRGYGASSAVWRSLPESEMRAVFVVVADVFREQTFQMAFVNCNDVIQEITPATPLSLAKTRGSPELQAFNNVTDLLRKLVISQAIIILARDNRRFDLLFAMASTAANLRFTWGLCAEHLNTARNAFRQQLHK